MTREQKQEYTRRISMANSTQMITIIYDIALSYLDEASDALDRDDKEALSLALKRVQKCIDELMRSLNRKVEVADNFLQLYIFAKRELIKVDIRGKRESLDSIRGIFLKMRDCYRELEQRTDEPPLVSGAQEVYAGLTYGPGSLNESVQDPYLSRGYNA
ncbi:flagellar export chaperone FliS [Butyrivibrio sp. MC2013]|uniref:flagellar export chaperone FliS n=1 Tax=Butyrivibrio sp. MC2013 TaxID=1280686 RepID=UPI0003FE2214|nr:flagellar protein FliS [Butyrivibrio sp. MC2013]